MADLDSKLLTALPAMLVEMRSVLFLKVDSQHVKNEWHPSHGLHW
jgi:hypothetical protein